MADNKPDSSKPLPDTVPESSDAVDETDDRASTSDEHADSEVIGTDDELQALVNEAAAERVGPSGSAHGLEPAAENEDPADGVALGRGEVDEFLGAGILAGVDQGVVLKDGDAALVLLEREASMRRLVGEDQVGVRPAGE